MISPDLYMTVKPAHLSEQVLLQVVARQQHLPLVLPTLEFVILPLSPEQARLLLRLKLLQTLLLVNQPLLFLPLWCRLVLVQFLQREKNWTFEGTVPEVLARGGLICEDVFSSVIRG